MKTQQNLEPVTLSHEWPAVQEWFARLEDEVLSARERAGLPQLLDKDGKPFDLVFLLEDEDDV